MTTTIYAQNFAGDAFHELDVITPTITDALNDAPTVELKLRVGTPDGLKMLEYLDPDNPHRRFVRVYPRFDVPGEQTEIDKRYPFLLMKAETDNIKDTAQGTVTLYGTHEGKQLLLWSILPDPSGLQDYDLYAGADPGNDVGAVRNNMFQLELLQSVGSAGDYIHLAAHWITHNMNGGDRAGLRGITIVGHDNLTKRDSLGHKWNTKFNRYLQFAYGTSMWDILTQLAGAGMCEFYFVGMKLYIVNPGSRGNNKADGPNPVVLGEGAEVPVRVSMEDFVTLVCVKGANGLRGWAKMSNEQLRKLHLTHHIAGEMIDASEVQQQSVITAYAQFILDQHHKPGREITLSYRVTHKKHAFPHGVSVGDWVAVDYLRDLVKERVKEVSVTEEEGGTKITVTVGRRFYPREYETWRRARHYKLHHNEDGLGRNKNADPFYDKNTNKNWVDKVNDAYNHPALPDQTDIGDVLTLVSDGDSGVMKAWRPPHGGAEYPDGGSSGDVLTLVDAESREVEWQETVIPEVLLAEPLRFHFSSLANNISTDAIDIQGRMYITAYRYNTVSGAARFIEGSNDQTTWLNLGILNVNPLRVVSPFRYIRLRAASGADNSEVAMVIE